MVEVLEEVVRGKGRPFLGICVGMQLLASRGLEYTVTEGLGCKAIRVTRPEDAQAAFATAREMMAEYRVPVVVEFILERVTNIAMGTEIDNIVEFEEVLDLPLDDTPASPEKTSRGELCPSNDQQEKDIPPCQNLQPI